MTALALTRIEGGLALEQAGDGAIRLVTGAPRGLEARLTGRAAAEAIYLTQQAGADAAVSHALAAAMVWEKATGVALPRNGLLLRVLLLALATLHAHLRQFYVQGLPDYLPWAELAAYRGSLPEVQRIARALKGRPAAYWARQPQPHPFSPAQVERLADSQGQAVEALDTLQRMLARLGGKFPVVMSIVPGGCAVPLTDALLIELRQELQSVAPAAGSAFEDGVLVAGLFPRLKNLGGSGMGLLSVGPLGEDLPSSQTLMPAGVIAGGRLEAFGSGMAESVTHSFYELPAQRTGSGPLLAPAPDKAGAYSWIKAPRYQRRPLEVGALARLAVLQPAASGATADLLDELTHALGAPLSGASSVAGRMLARLTEARLLVRRCGELLEQLAPGQPTVAAEAGRMRVTGEGSADVEASAGSLRHRGVFERGKIASWDIVAPSTWNGSPRDETGAPGALEAALASAALDLRQRDDRLAASRIVHSFAFSTIDALH